MTDKKSDVWFVRGISAEFRDKVNKVARARRQTVAELVIELLEPALDAGGSSGPASAANDVVERLMALEARVKALEGGAVAPNNRRETTPSRVAATGERRGGNPGYGPEIERRIREMLLAGASNAKIAGELGIDASSVSRRRSAMKAAGQL